MPLPDDFSPWQHLHEMMLNAHNRNVQQTFTGVPDDDISTSLGGMKVACLLEDDDTVDMTMLRMFLFYFVFQSGLPQPVYAYPPEELFTAVRGHPQVVLLFREHLNIEQKALKQRAAESQITFRLMQYTAQTITPAYAAELALLIKERLGEAGGFQWERGHIKVTYKDPVHGYDFYLLVLNEGEGQRVIEQIVSIQGHPFDEQKLTVHTAKKTFPANPGYQEIYGKERPKPRLRPVTPVKFLRAELHIQDIGKPVVLVSRVPTNKPLQRF